MMASGCVILLFPSILLLTHTLLPHSKLYGQSKLGNLFLSGIFARDHAGKIVTTSVHPGGIRTELQRHAEAGTGFVTWLTKGIFNLILFPAP